MQNEDNSKSKTRFVLIGGFLGAGKTTVVAALVRWLRERELRCGLITNDQGGGLVDSALARQQTGAVAEITGGCFCCRLDDLVAAVRRLSTEERPDVFLAEPVGSCTDLMATVLLPLQKVYALPLEVAPHSVLLDGRRAFQTLLGGGRARGFSKEVSYIYRKQMEEAEMLVINKTDLLTGGQLEKLIAKLHADFLGRRVFAVSAHTGEGLEDWFAAVLAEGSEPKDLMEVDYARYGEGEALLGWLNATVRIAAGRAGVDGAELLHGLVHTVMAGLENAGAEVAHLKMSVQEEGGAMLRVQVTRSEEKPVFAGVLSGPVRQGELLINLRAEAEPEVLATTVSAAVATHLDGVEHEMAEFASFKPGQPVPTHRAEALA